MADPRPVEPLASHEMAYLRAMRRLVVTPFGALISRRFGEARSAAEVRAILATLQTLPLEPGLTDFITRYAEVADTAHLRKFTSTFSSALRIDIRPMFQADEFKYDLLLPWVSDNVRLIKTVQPRHILALDAAVYRAFLDKPFDRAELKRVVATVGRSSGYNLRRIVRDQSSKLNGQLNEHRQRQVGVAEYTWQTSNDERVRPSHVALNGQRFSWNEPPVIDGERAHPGRPIQCRCTARPYIDETVLEQLGDRGATPPPSVAKAVKRKGRRPPAQPQRRLAPDEDDGTFVDGRPRNGADARRRLLELDEESAATVPELVHATHARRQAISEFNLAARRHGWDSPELLAARENYRAATRRLHDAENARVRFLQRERRLIRHNANPPNLDHITTNTSDAQMRRSFDDVKSALGQMIRTYGRPVPTKVTFSKNTRRAGNRRHRRGYPDVNVVVTCGRPEDRKTIMHEICHSLEEDQPGLAQDALSHRNGRRLGPIESMRDLTGFQGLYGPDETGYPSDFLTPYMSRDYGSYFSEVISSGMEYMYDDPLLLAIKDPKTFDFIYERVMQFK